MLAGTTVEGQESAVQKFRLNKINPPLNFMRFFKTLRFFVASTFAARL
jgi:hypothetical protein